MKEGNMIVEKIRKKSLELPQKIVIDEELPNGWFRVLTSEMRPKGNIEEYLDYRLWRNEKGRYLHRTHLDMLLSKKQLHEIREGHVFLIRNKRAKSIYKEMREHVKNKTKKLLVREGKMLDEVKVRG